jgi:hypothetical protein
MDMLQLHWKRHQHRSDSLPLTLRERAESAARLRHPVASDPFWRNADAILHLE